jgi:hypothetical protein
MKSVEELDGACQVPSHAAAVCTQSSELALFGRSFHRGHMRTCKVELASKQQELRAQCVEPTT